MSMAERRLLPVIALAFAGWVSVPFVAPLLPDGAWEDGTIAVLIGLALFLIPDGTGRKMLEWREADRAPWAVIMMFGGGLALAAAMTKSGLAAWIGASLLPLSAWPLLLVASSPAASRTGRTRSGTSHGAMGACCHRQTASPQTDLPKELARYMPAARWY